MMNDDWDDTRDKDLDALFDHIKQTFGPWLDVIALAYSEKFRPLHPDDVAESLAQAMEQADEETFYACISAKVLEDIH